ncbi:hypothetical protein [Lewinella sp. W8]|uniref:hypothetical protein n=1 Tax=Lewinella sp. W8 TaxID=2528208 RepID=UPI00106873EF|nr:hypothetical protein [Lewinella sp. W8]MTB53490.1 hypothetical protein [Lewinella sp. W8]
MSQNAIDVASRFGDIPFKDFTVGLVTEVFDALVESHMLQVEEYADLVQRTSQDLSVYINNTKDGVSFSDVTDFVLAYELPEPPTDTLENLLKQLESPTATKPDIDKDEASGTADPDVNGNSTPGSWWGALITSLAPAINNLVDKIEDPNKVNGLQAIQDYNQAVLDGADTIADKIPTYQAIQSAIASLITSNKYGILQSVIKQGMMRLVVTEGEIETRITFSTWNNSSSGSSTSSSLKNKVKTKEKERFGRGLPIWFYKKNKRKNVTRRVTVNTAKSYQRDSSGTSVNIFGRCLIRFKSDYAPLNG